MRSAAPVTRNHLSKPEDLMLQNATPLRKSAPSSPNISDEHVSCTPPATENVSFQILFKRPTPAIVFGNATRPSRFAHCWKGAQSPATATQTDIWTSKSAPYPQFFALLTSKCASRHNGVHFFDTSTSKSAPKLTCFVHFDFKMCFAPQRRTLFRRLNFQKCSEADVLCTFWLGNVLRATTAFSIQKWSENGVLCAFWLGNVLRATTACTFSTSQLPKVLRSWCVLHILAWKCASRHNGVHFFDTTTSKSGPTLVCFVHFDLQMRFARNFSSLIWPHGSAPAALASLPSGVFCDFPTFSRTCIFFLLTLSLLCSSLFGSSPLWLFPPLLFHLFILSEVWVLNFLLVRYIHMLQLVRKYSFDMVKPCTNGNIWKHGFNLQTNEHFVGYSWSVVGVNPSQDQPSNLLAAVPQHTYNHPPTCRFNPFK